MRNPDPNFWRDRSVFLSGHTGFKGGWIALWLAHLGARVHGYSLSPSTKPSFFIETKVQNRCETSTIADVRDLNSLCQAVRNANPSIVIHMAAQSLVRKSYDAPVDTFSTNLLGTVNLLEATRAVDSVEAFINITSDKCYQNEECIRPYREDDQLGGHDPYSSSKACAELITAAYRSSFLQAADVNVATVRAGNVIGGGDWAKDRLIPDLLRALDAGGRLLIRSPTAARPWQHVLEPLSGYLLLAEQLVRDGANYAGPWNFGPEGLDAQRVSWIIEWFSENVSNIEWSLESVNQPHEAKSLYLDSSKAKSKLNWRSRWALEAALMRTIDWHKAWKRGDSMSAFSIQQIEDYQAQ